MKRKEPWYRLLYFLPLLFFLIAVNLIGDGSNCFDRRADRMVAASLLEGVPARITTGNNNEREIKKYLIENMEKEVGTIAIGPSLIIFHGSELVGDDSFYNLGVSKGDHYDMMAQFAMLKLNGVKFNKVIFCIDESYFTDASYVNNNYLHDPLMGYSDYMVEYLNGNENPEIPKANLWTRFRHAPVLSLSYFQDSLVYFPGHLHERFSKNGEKEIERIYGESNKYHYDVDGSSIEGAYERNAKPDYIKKNAEEYEVAGVFGCEIEEEYKRQFELLIDYLEKQDVEIVFWYCPISPALWDMVNWDDYPALMELYDYTKALADSKGIATIGSYNPHEVGIEDEDYYDSRHLKREIIGNYFDFH